MCHTGARGVTASPTPEASPPCLRPAPFASCIPSQKPWTELTGVVEVRGHLNSLAQVAPKAITAEQRDALRTLPGALQLYIEPWDVALQDLTDHVETAVPVNWPVSRPAIATAVRTPALKQRITRTGGLQWPDFKAVAQNRQQLPVPRSVAADFVRTELLRAVHVAAVQAKLTTSICDDSIVWTEADCLKGRVRPPIPAGAGDIDAAALRAVMGGPLAAPPDRDVPPAPALDNRPKPRAGPATATEALYGKIVASLFALNAQGRAAIALRVAADRDFPEELRAQAALGGDGWVDAYSATAQRHPLTVHLALWDIARQVQQDRGGIDQESAPQPPSRTHVVAIGLPEGVSVTDLNAALRISVGSDGFDAQQEDTGATYLLIPCDKGAATVLTAGLTIKGKRVAGSVATTAGGKPAPAPAQDSKPKSAQAGDREQSRCVGCNSKEHSWALCWAWERGDECRQCGELGHYKWVCEEFHSERQALKSDRPECPRRHPGTGGAHRASMEGRVCRGKGRVLLPGPDDRRGHQVWHNARLPLRSCHSPPRP